MPNPKPSFGGYTVTFAPRAETTLGQVFGTDPLTPAQMTKRLWHFIKSESLAKQAPR